MDSTVIVAGMGFLTTILAATLTSWSQHRVARDSHLLEARLRVYGECSDSLFEYARATYNRAKARLDEAPSEQRDLRRQEAYRCNARARAAIGQAAILTMSESLEQRLSEARRKIGTMTEFESAEDLT